MARVSTARERAFRRDEIARISALREAGKIRLRWGRICAYLLALGSGAAFLGMFVYMLGEFIDRL